MSPLESRRTPGGKMYISGERKCSTAGSFAADGGSVSDLSLGNTVRFSGEKNDSSLGKGFWHRPCI